jgi:zinc protease
LTADTTELSFTSGARQLDEVLQRLGPLLTAPRLDSVDIEREKDLMESALAKGPDDPAWIATRVFPRMLYGEHRYGSPSLGYPATVEKLSRDDVAAQYKKHFLPGGSTLIVVGDVDPDALVATLEKDWQAWQGSGAPSSREAAKTVGDPETVYIVDKPGAVQSVLVAGRIWHDRSDSNYFPGQIGNRVLGGDFLSRINQNLRERNGFTYGARSDFQFRRLGGDWLTRTSVRADVTGKALRELVNELDGPLGDRPISEVELQVAQQAELNEFPAWFETPDSMNSLLSEIVTNHVPKDFLTRFDESVRTMQLDEVSQVMETLLDHQHRFFLVVGDQAEIIPQLEEAGFHRFKFLDSDGKPLSN